MGIRKKQVERLKKAAEEADKAAEKAAKGQASKEDVRRAQAAYQAVVRSSSREEIEQSIPE